jgi:predicted aspartyl protease
MALADYLSALKNLSPQNLENIKAITENAEKISTNIKEIVSKLENKEFTISIKVKDNDIKKF